jgi:hypothetical protein
MRQEEVHEEAINNVNNKKVLSEEGKGRQDYLAGELARRLGDEKNLKYYRSISDKFPEATLFETASIVKDLFRQGKVKESRGPLFMRLLNRKSASPDIG